MLAVSSETRERARATSRKIRDAFDALADGSSDRASLAALSAEFKATLNRFSEVAEMTAPAPRPPPRRRRGRWRCRSASARRSRRWRRAARRRRRGAGAADGGGRAAGDRDERADHPRARGVFRQINQQVHEVSEIFQDLALLVSEQGEHIDNIQTNIESAANNTARGAPQARASRGRARGWMCMFGVLLIIVIVALILVLKFALKMI